MDAEEALGEVEWELQQAEGEVDRLRWWRDELVARAHESPPR